MIASICGIFGRLLNLFYNIFGQNYGWALIGFTLLVNLLLLPLTLKQQKSTAEMQIIQPELMKIQAKYKNNKEKLNEETLKLYQKYNINPMSGCLPLLIQMPIILILYQVIIRPLSYMQGLTKAQIAELTTLVSGNANSAALNEVTLASDAAKLSADQLSQLSFDFTNINFDFLGLDLGATPNLGHFSLLWIIPILAGVTTYLLSWYTMRQANAKKSEEDKKREENSAANQMQTMNKIMPLITVYFAFNFAAGIGFYWIMNNVFRFLQQVVISKIVLDKKDPLVVDTKKGK